VTGHGLANQLNNGMAHALDLVPEPFERAHDKDKPADDPNRPEVA
jgi:hypothetical protein